MANHLVPGTLPYESMVPGEDEKYAGAHVLNMILASGEVGAGAQNIAALYAHANGYDDGTEMWPYWYIDPAAMVATLDDIDPRVGAGLTYWLDEDFTGQSVANTALVGTLSTFNTAAAALVNGGKHWVEIVGWSTDNANALSGFIVNDPAYAGGGAQQGVDLAFWNTAYTAVAGGNRWRGKFVYVGDPRPPESKIAAGKRAIKRPGEVIIPPDQAVQLALEGAREKYPDLAHIQRAIAEGRPGEPRLVARIDREETAYYIVPLEAGSEGAAVGAIIVDARYGDVLSASGAEKPYQLFTIAREEVAERLASRPIRIPRPLGTQADLLTDEVLRLTSRTRLSEGTPSSSLRQTLMAALGSQVSAANHVRLRSSDIEVSNHLAWAPCFDSATPFHPFYVARTPWHVLYMNAHSGIVRAGWDYCSYSPLGA